MVADCAYLPFFCPILFIAYKSGWILNKEYWFVWNGLPCIISCGRFCACLIGIGCARCICVFVCCPCFGVVFCCSWWAPFSMLDRRSFCVLKPSLTAFTIYLSLDSYSYSYSAVCSSVLLSLELLCSFWDEFSSLFMVCFRLHSSPFLYFPWVQNVHYFFGWLSTQLFPSSQ